MTFLHFLNCAMLTYAPTVVVDRSSVVAEENRARLYFWVLLVYIGCQLAKMVLAATFLPLPEEDGGFSVTREVALTVLGVVDVYGIASALKRARFASRWSKILGVGLAWTLMDAVLSKFLPLWVSARGTEFSWANAQMGIDANIRMISFIAMAGLVWVSMISRRSTPFAGLGLAVVLATPGIKEYVITVLGLGAWVGLGVQFGLALLSALVARIAYSVVTQPRRKAQA